MVMLTTKLGPLPLYNRSGNAIEYVFAFAPPAMDAGVSRAPFEGALLLFQETELTSMKKKNRFMLRYVKPYELYNDYSVTDPLVARTLGENDDEPVARTLEENDNYAVPIDDAPDDICPSEPIPNSDAAHMLPPSDQTFVRPNAKPPPPV